ncbi:hypothetical protein Q3G72_009746 [Acer saccharum]|nr:hypothetical protein Q3G72_009746 [Acer saccharum]
MDGLLALRWRPLAKKAKGKTLFFKVQVIDSNGRIWKERGKKEAILIKLGAKIADLLLKCQNNEDVWLSRCDVGTLKEFTNVSNVNLHLSSRGFAFSSAYLGDKFIL